MTSTVSDFIVRPYESADRTRLLDLMRQVWSRKVDVDKHVESRWWWQWDEPPIYLAESPGEGRLVGLCAFIPFTLLSSGRELSCAWLVDFFVLAECQGRGLGKRLTEAVQNRFDLTASFSQTDMAYRVFRKLGWSARAPMPLYVHPRPMRWMFARASGGLRVSVRPIDQARDVTADLDSLWTRVGDAYPLIAVRSAERLLRRYATQGDRAYSLLCGHREQACVGYMIVRVVHSRSGGAPAAHGLIVDYLVHPDDGAAFAALLSRASATLIDRGVKRIFCISTSPRCQRVLASRGFLSPGAPLIGRALLGNRKWLTYHAKIVSCLVDPAAWFLTMGDCDIDYAWHQE
jgi:GNAT superfamily N-acetyltransferase